MGTTDDDGFPADDEMMHVGARGREDRRVECIGAAGSCEAHRVEPDGGEVGGGTRLEDASVAPTERPVPVDSGDRSEGFGGVHASLERCNPLAHLDGAGLLEEVDDGVGVRAHAEVGAGEGEGLARADAVCEVALGGGAETAPRSGLTGESDVTVGSVRSVDQCRAGTEPVGVVDHDDRGSAVNLEALPVLGRLFGNVNVEGRVVLASPARRDPDRRWFDGTDRMHVSTGFGALAAMTIPTDRRAALQRSLIRSHAAGMGPAVEVEVVRAMMFLRARTLALGASGTRPLVAETLVRIINAGIVPVVPEHGSLGASGDLAPLAHVALVLIGEGDVVTDDGVRDGAAALARASIEPLELAEKEGLALTNGTDGMLGMLCLAVHDASHLLTVADIVAALSVEGLLATDRAYAADLLAFRPHPGQAASAANLRAVLAGSSIVASHRTDDVRVQDAYSVRCTPQVHGAARDTLGFVTEVTDRELASAIDNPMVLPDGRVESCGNFHGAPVAMAADYLAIALAEVGAIAERRLDRLLDRNRSQDLPPFLADDPGVDSGLMIGQYTAAAMCAENRRLAAPASVDSLPTSAMQEDHISMGWGAARKLRGVIDNLRRILAIEWVAAARAIDLRAPLRPAGATAAAVSLLRTEVPGPGPDRPLSPELQAAERLLADEALVEAIEAVTGALA